MQLQTRMDYDSLPAFAITRHTLPYRISLYVVKIILPGLSQSACALVTSAGCGVQGGAVQWGADSCRPGVQNWHEVSSWEFVFALLGIRVEFL